MAFEAGDEAERRDRPEGGLPGPRGGREGAPVGAEGQFGDTARALVRDATEQFSGARVPQAHRVSLERGGQYLRVRAEADAAPRSAQARREGPRLILRRSVKAVYHAVGPERNDDVGGAGAVDGEDRAPVRRGKNTQGPPLGRVPNGDSSRLIAGDGD